MAGQAAASTAVMAQQVDAHSLGRAALTAQAVGMARSAFLELSNFYDSSEITATATSLARRIEGVQKAQAALTNAYLSKATGTLRGRRVKPGRVIDVRELRPGITHAGVYGRVTDFYRYRVSEGDAEEVALDLAVKRAEVIAETDVDLAFRDMANRFMEEQQVAQWRRVIRPERSTGGSCGLCVAASTRLYSKSDLLPIHARCKCTVLPVTDDNDPGLQLNEDDFELLYGEDSDTRAATLKRGRYVVKQHGELGPVLVVAGEDFRGPKQVAADTR